MSTATMAPLVLDIIGPGANAGRGDLSWVGGLLWIVLTATAAIRWMLAGMEFDRLYQAMGDADVPSNDELAARYSRQPARLFSDAPNLIPRLLRAYWTPHPDPVVERVRRRMRNRFLVTVAVGLIGMTLPAMFARIGG